MTDFKKGQQVMPPGPWTERGTYLMFDEEGTIRIALLTDHGWVDFTTGDELFYATDIAPFNPVRLIPEPTARPTLEERLARRLPPDHPEYDAFYDATDEQVAAMVEPFGGAS